MNHAFTKYRMSNFSETLDTLETNGNNIPLIFGEVGSALGGAGSADYDLNARLGAALWTVDWLLYSMTFVSHPPPALHDLSSALARQTPPKTLPTDTITRTAGTQASIHATRYCVPLRRLPTCHGQLLDEPLQLSNQRHRPPRPRAGRLLR